MSKHEHTVALREMRKDEFAEFRDEFIEDWAEDLSRVEDIPLDSPSRA